MNRDPEQIRGEVDRALTAVRTPEDLEAIRVRYVGRKAGVVRDLLQALGDLPPQERAAAGKAANGLRVHVEESLARVRRELGARVRPPAAATVDPTLPGRRPDLGLPHPISRMSNRIEEIFLEMGYSVEDGR